YHGDTDIHDRVARHYAALQSLLDTLFDARDKLFWNSAAHDLVDKLKALPGFQRLDLQLAVSILSGTAGLALQGNTGRRLAVDALAIGHLGRAEVRLDPVCPLQDVHLDIQVKFAHTA